MSKIGMRDDGWPKSCEICAQIEFQTDCCECPNKRPAPDFSSLNAKHAAINSELENLKVYKRAIKTFGQQSQINVAIEEMSELTKELCKLNRGRDNKAEILEEIADVYIMMHQLTLIFDDATEMNVIKNIDSKTRRLEGMINDQD